MEMGDRLIAVDEQGYSLSGDHVLAIIAKYYKDHDLLNNNLVITTVMSNFGLYKKRLNLWESITVSLTLETGMYWR